MAEQAAAKNGALVGPRGPGLPSLPAELLLMIFANLAYPDCLRVSAASRFFHAFVAHALPPAAKRDFQMLAVRTFLRYTWSFLCVECGRISTADCFAGTNREARCENSLVAGRNAHVTGHTTRVSIVRQGRISAAADARASCCMDDSRRRCIDCSIAAGEYAIGQVVFADKWDGHCIARRCPVCDRAKASRAPNWCAACGVCNLCLRDWTCSFSGFCDECERWRADADAYYRQRGAFPQLHDPYYRGWYPEKRFIMTGIRPPPPPPPLSTLRFRGRVSRVWKKLVLRRTEV